MKRTLASSCIISLLIAQSAIAAPASTLFSNHHTTSVKHRLSEKDKSIFVSANCTGSGISDVCIAVGLDRIKGWPMPPYLSVSVDGANTWNRKTVPNLPVVESNNIGSALGEVSCTNHANLCVAVGNYSFLPFIVVSHDKGSSWSIKFIGDNLSIGEFTRISCSSGDEPVCAAGGGIVSSSGRNALLVVSSDKGNSWQFKTIPNISAHRISSVSCTGSGATATCSAIGQSFDKGSLVGMSTDGGNTWENKVIPGLPRNSFLYSTTCTGTGLNTVCVVVGSNNQNPIVATTMDKGKSWNIKNVTKTDLSQYGVFDDAPLPGHATCIGGRGPNAICTTVSDDDRIAISNDGGAHWEIKKIS
jgi:hypothetical protein